MRMGLVIGLVTLFIGLSLINGIMEMQYLSGTGIESVFYRLTHYEWNSIADVIVNVGQFFSAFVDMITFNYAMFTGAWQIVQYALFLPLSIGFVTAIVLALRGVGSS
jgi:hypothetical protein